MLEKILEKIQSKGWELYEMRVEDTVQPGPVPSLAPGKSYFFLPRNCGPNGALQLYVALCYGRGEEAAPYVHYRGERLSVFNLRIENKSIVPMPFKLRIAYESFFCSLDTLNFAPGPN